MKVLAIHQGNNTELELQARRLKPPMGQPCNQCGWCCLTQVCPVGEELTKSSKAPCQLLIQEGDRHYCKLASHPILANILDIGGGCDARTVEEQLKELMK